MKIFVVTGAMRFASSGEVHPIIPTAYATRELAESGLRESVAEEIELQGGTPSAAAVEACIAAGRNSQEDHFAVFDNGDCRICWEIDEISVQA